jgi:ribosomal protein L11 methyltransferase
LAIAAAKLGAAQVDAVDVDADALAVTGENARDNDAAVNAFTPERLPPGNYDIVAANILAQPLLVLEPLLAARTRRGGRIALAGILDEQAPGLVRAYGAHFEARVAGRESGWALVEGRRR